MSAKHNDAATADDNDTSPGDTFDRETLLASVDPETVRTVVKLLLGMGGLIFLLAIVSFLPGLDRLVPATPITFAALVVALVTLGIVGVLMYVAPHLETLVKQEFTGSEALGSHLAAIVKQLVMLLAILVAYRGLAGAIVPFLADTNTGWAYDLAFLTLALIPTALIALNMYRGLDPAANLLTGKVTSTGGRGISPESEPAADQVDQDASSDKPAATQTDPSDSDDRDDEHPGDAADTADT